MPTSSSQAWPAAPRGKSGRAILAAIISGEESSERLADLALGHLRLKIPQLQAALEGKVREHHRFLLQSWLRQLGFIETEIELLDARLDQLGQEHRDLAEALNRWTTVPGVDRVAAWSFIAEIGADCGSFPNAAHLASWAGVCPGKQRERTQADQQQDPQRQPMVASYGVSVCMGCGSHKEYLSLRSV